ncbi:WD repeat-containing protein 36 [Teleopsis dalmanni]|uniref:WD repeat-containing protein 36 n=1 Tax=Teleopsis dalmanni TaxID=139649 RepID=UPI000D32B38A|nr:WD repeat-containing protein 36 [Teleopsis dalmanni]
MTNMDSETSIGNERSASKIFRQNRSIGYVSNHIGAVTRYVVRRSDNLIATCIGRTFQVYTASHFRLLHVSPIHADDITALAIDLTYIYTASDKCIYAWRSGKHRRHVYKGTSNVWLILPLGGFLVTVDEANVLKVWNVVSENVYFEIPFNKSEFLITAVTHPPTYVNKVLIGSEQGIIKLWNLKENRLIYTFSARKCAITCLEASPALDVVAIGYHNGCIVLLNLKYDEILMEFKQDWGMVSKISFRTDGPPIMVSSSATGNVAFWNLEERKVASQLKVHEGKVTTTICFPNEPLLLTTSPDNSMKLWIFDMSDGGARLLRIREGHTKPPLCIRYYGNSGSSILSSGEDSSLRIFSTISETFNKSMGKASYNRKASKKKNRFQKDWLRMPPIVQFTTETTREKEWDSIAAIHSGIIQTTTWSFHRCCMGEHRLIPTKFENRNRTDLNAETTSITLSSCGNFAIIGYSTGDLERFNIQSGIHRCSYGAPAHESSVRGVASDNLNQFVTSGCGAGLLKFWPFKGNVTSPTLTLKFSDGIDLLRSHRESGMIAIALVNFIVYIVDTDTKVIIRKFEGHITKINDICFSPDSRWLITASMDATIKVWDIPSTYMIDHFRTERPCVSLTMSPTGDFLATAHVNYLGIYLWANRTLFNQLSLRSINPYEKAPLVGLPSNAYDDIVLNQAVQEMSLDAYEDEGEEIEFKYETQTQLSKELITLSGVAASRWQNLLDLDIIKKRNKPKSAPKIPKQAPFFLPTIAGPEMKFDLTATVNEANVHSKILNTSPLNNMTTLAKLLEETETANNYEPPINYLKKLGPSMVDYEIKSLHPLSASIAAMVQFLKTIEYTFSTNKDFELAQSYLSVFLRAHGSTLIELPEVVQTLKSVSVAQETCWNRIEKKLSYGIGVVAALRNYVK